MQAFALSLRMEGWRERRKWKGIIILFWPQWKNSRWKTRLLTCLSNYAWDRMSELNAHTEWKGKSHCVLRAHRSYRQLPASIVSTPFPYNSATTKKSTEWPALHPSSLSPLLHFPFPCDSFSTPSRSPLPRLHILVVEMTAAIPTSRQLQYKWSNVVEIEFSLRLSTEKRKKYHGGISFRLPDRKHRRLKRSKELLSLDQYHKTYHVTFDDSKSISGSTLYSTKSVFSFIHL